MCLLQVNECLLQRVSVLVTGEWVFITEGKCAYYKISECVLQRVSVLITGVSITDGRCPSLSQKSECWGKCAYYTSKCLWQGVRVLITGKEHLLHEKIICIAGRENFIAGSKQMCYWRELLGYVFNIRGEFIIGEKCLIQVKKNCNERSVVFVTLILFEEKRHSKSLN